MEGMINICQYKTFTHQWNPAQLKPSSTLSSHYLSIVASRADVTVHQKQRKRIKGFIVSTARLRSVIIVIIIHPSSYARLASAFLTNLGWATENDGNA